MTATHSAAAWRLRPSRTYFGPLATGAALAGGLVASAGADDGLVLCPFRRCTGGYCPGCGATRAAHRFVHGDIHASWGHHPWVVLAVVQAVAVGAALAFMAPHRRRDRMRRFAVPVMLVNSTLMVGIWLIRLWTDAIPSGWL